MVELASRGEAPPGEAIDRPDVAPPATGEAPKAPEEGGGVIVRDPTPPKRTSAAMKWCFTWNGFEELKIPLFVMALEEVVGNGSGGSASGGRRSKTDTWYIFQEEKAPTTGALHLQGAVWFGKKQRPLESRSRCKIH